jgi:hypothetical protein
LLSYYGILSTYGVIFITGVVVVQLDPVCCEIVKVTAEPDATFISKGNPLHTEFVFIEAVAASVLDIVSPPHVICKVLPELTEYPESASV